MVKVLDCSLEVIEFELQPRLTFTLGLISLGKGWDRLIKLIWDE